MGVDSNTGTTEILATVDKPVGLMVLGERNPVGMTREGFSSDPGLLFHGTKELFEFKRGFDYSKGGGSHSWTIGEGFYTTPERYDAKLFSLAFDAREPVVLEFLPFQAKVFDFRQVSDLKKNAYVPSDMLTGYVEYYSAIYNEKWGNYDPKEDDEFIRTHPSGKIKQPPTDATFLDYFKSEETQFDEERSIRSKKSFSYLIASQYLVILRNFTDKKVDLREMLSVKGDPQVSEYACKFFRDFILTEGYDGIVYVEGGDHPEHQLRGPASVVFFNLEKIFIS